MLLGNLAHGLADKHKFNSQIQKLWSALLNVAPLDFGEQKSQYSSIRKRPETSNLVYTISLESYATTSEGLHATLSSPRKCGFQMLGKLCVQALCLCGKKYKGMRNGRASHQLMTSGAYSHVTAVTNKVLSKATLWSSFLGGHNAVLFPRSAVRYLSTNSFSCRVSIRNLQ